MRIMIEGLFSHPTAMNAWKNESYRNDRNLVQENSKNQYFLFLRNNRALQLSLETSFSTKLCPFVTEDESTIPQTISFDQSSFRDVQSSLKNTYAWRALFNFQKKFFHGMFHFFKLYSHFIRAGMSEDILLQKMLQLSYAHRIFLYSKNSNCRIKKKKNRKNWRAEISTRKFYRWTNKFFQLGLTIICFFFYFSFPLFSTWKGPNK